MSGVEPTVSVVLCTFNGGAFLEPLLDSLVRQSRRIDELVVADDGSSDDSLMLVQARASALARNVTIQRRECNLGAARNFSMALGAASGDIVILCDQDDVWQPRKVAATFERFVAEPALALLQHDASLVDPHGSRLRGSLYERLGVEAATGPALFQSLLRRNLSPGCTLAAHRELLRLALPVPDGFMHDEWLALFAASLGRFRQITDRLIAYRLHPGNTLGLRGVGVAAVFDSVGADAVRARGAKIARLTSLQQRLLRLDDGPLVECVSLLDEAVEHLRLRQRLPPRARDRLAHVFAEWQSGRYRRHGSGTASALRDLMGL